jgi:hypothetical protein
MTANEMNIAMPPRRGIKSLCMCREEDGAYTQPREFAMLRMLRVRRNEIRAAATNIPSNVTVI